MRAILNPCVLRVCLLLQLFAPALHAEDGMWLFNAPPTAQIKTKYGFELTPAWLEHFQRASIRFDNGGSGAFVSSNGLAVTNHHIASDCLHALSDSQHDYLVTGFYARKHDQELRCPNLELNVLEKITDVTGNINSTVKPGMSDAQAGQAQRSAMAAIEKQCATAPAIRCDVVILYSGEKFNLYQYHRYTDVRLVFAPESAFFGGDADNFEFPRYDLDVAFFRVYGNGKPVKPNDYLRWSQRGTKSGDLIFVAGNPGSTARGDTLNQIYFEKNTRIPWLLADYQRRINLLQEFSIQSAENARIAQQALSNLQNNLKRYQGYLAGLNDPGLMNRKKGDERRILIFSRRGPRGRRVIPAMQQIDRALETYHKIFPAYILLARPAGSYRDTGAFRGRLAAYAMTLVQAAGEKQKPNGDRLREYRDSALPSLEQNLFSTAPVYKSLETEELADSLAEMQKELGDENAVVKAALKGRTPQEVAQELIQKTRLDDVSYRKQLYVGGSAAIAASNDQLITMFREINPELLSIRKQYEDEVESVLQRNRPVLEEFRTAFGGVNIAPDATFTLRLSYGQVSGYVEDGRGTAPKGTNVSPLTDFADAFAHAEEHGNQDDYELPASWRREKKHLDLKTPLNFVSTADIIGESSGGPVVDRQGELVGIVFDGNIQSLPWNFLYDDRQGRAVSVDSRAVIQALRKVYHAGALADELKRGH